MKNDIGNRIYQNIKKPARELVEQFRGIPSSNIGDMMNRLYCMREYIKPISYKPVTMIGTAFTVKVPTGDNAFIHLALDLANPGDVLVVDGGGCVTRSLMGEIMFTYAQNQGLAGIIIDGAIRDSDSTEHLSIPVYAAGITPQGPYKNGPGEINVPVSCGGQVVHPGDILVGDSDGICVIYPEDAEKILEAVHEKFNGEQILLEQYHTTGNDRENHRKTYASIAECLRTFYY